jgi:hypothetical protein
MAGSTVTAEDFAKTLAGTYEDAALEAARRLDAVAARGFEELQAHPDWAELLKIPPDVLAGSEEALKAWAAGAAASVRNLERADLIDWDAFADNFQKGLDREAARKYTLDVALSELNARGLLEGSEEERKKKVAEALGMGEPELTFEALFRAEASAGQNLVSQVGVLDIPAMLKLIEGFSPDDMIDQWLAEYDSPSGVVPIRPETPTGFSPDDLINEWLAEYDSPSGVVPVKPSVEAGEVDPVDVGALVNVETVAGELQAAGARAIELVETGAETYLLTTNIANSVATTWSASFAASSDTFAAIGTSLGATVSSAFQAAMEENVGMVRKRIAELVAPEVATILGRRGGGAMP